ncbi:MAG: trypsin-like peptidase domain-containing protein [Candidatus Sungbacteria bacterium]|uniref:Trypsin-like peptidase domain-containing protein n=1 Tax=Candidatus Sungiibacteriota bacterium TaxID=2750080 RepID=A0A931YDM6_9BACT|nr:trypsin-like peptidase domain-containing protein [Candidatus Sungbacteria bacterium]
MNLIVDAIKKVRPAVVSVVITKEIPEELLNQMPYFGPGGLLVPPEEKKEGNGGGVPMDHEKIKVGGGSGFIVSRDGLVITNKHVVQDPEATYTVVMENEQRFPAKVLARDPINDIAILKIESEKELPFVKLADSNRLDLGETAIAIGNTLGEFKNTVSVGVVSGLSRFITAQNEFNGEPSFLRGLIQTDAAINPGNSGGPLINIKGEAVGINVAVILGAQNVGFTIPINSAAKDLDDLKKFGRLRKPFLGVRYLIINKDMKDRLKLPVEAGAYVMKENVPGDEAVVTGSPADKAGLKEKDIILEFNGVKLTSEKNLQDVLENCKIGANVPLKVLRAGQEQELKLVLEERKF